MIAAFHVRSFRDLGRAVCWCVLLCASLSARGSLNEDMSPRVQCLIQQLQDPSVERRIDAARQIAEIGQKASEAIPHLIQVLDDRASDVHGVIVGEAASDSLARMGKPAVLACLSAHRKRESSEQVEMLVKTISRFRDQESIDALIALINDPNPSKRASAIIAVNKSADRRLVPALIDALRDRDDGVRFASARYFEIHRDERAVEPLIDALSDEQESVRIQAARALGEQRDHRASPLLCQIVKDSKRSLSVRRAAAEALGKIGSSDAFDTLIRYVQDSGQAPSLRLGAISGLGHLGDRRASDSLIQVLQDRRHTEDERVYAAEAIMAIDQGAAISIIIPVVQDGAERPYVRFWMGVKLVEATGGRLANARIVEALTCYRFETRGLAVDPTREAAFDAFSALSKKGESAQVRSAAQDELSILQKVDSGKEVESKVQEKPPADSELLKLVQEKWFCRIACCSYYVLALASWMSWYRWAASVHRRTVRPVYILIALISAGIPLAILCI